MGAIKVKYEWTIRKLDRTQKGKRLWCARGSDGIQFIRTSHAKIIFATETYMAKLKLDMTKNTKTYEELE